MEADRHRIWNLVGNNFTSLSENAPQGYRPLVEVFLVGRAEPIRLAQVQTTRNPAFPWILLVAESDGSDLPAPDEALVFVLDQYVERIEIRFVRSDGRSVGFSHQVLDASSSDQ